MKKSIIVISKVHLDTNGNRKYIINVFNSEGGKINNQINIGRKCKNGISIFAGDLQYDQLNGALLLYIV